MTFLTLSGLCFTLAGALAIYLASPNQRWLDRALPARPARLAGAVLLAAGWLALRQAMQSLTACFVWLTWLMLVFTLLPYFGALHVPHGGQRDAP